MTKVKSNRFVLTEREVQRRDPTENPPQAFDGGSNQAKSCTRDYWRFVGREDKVSFRHF